MLLQECACGEPLIEHQPKCPKCGKPNPYSKRSRWRIFWPDVDDLAGAHEAIQLGYWAAFLAAAAGAIVSLIPGVGPGHAGLLDAGLYAICGLGTWRHWRSAALLAFLLCVANILLSVSHGHGVGVLVIFIFVGLLNGVRGTFVAARFAKQSQPSGAG